MPAVLSRRFDTREISRPDLLRQINALTDEAREQIGAPVARTYQFQGTELIVNWTRAGSTDTLVPSQAMNGLDAEITHEVHRQNRKQARMGKLQQIAERAPAVIKALEARAEKLGPRLDALETKGNGAFDRWDSYVTDQENAVTAAEDAINQLSNSAPPGPLPGS